MIKKAKTKFIIFTLVGLMLLFSCLFVIFLSALKKGTENEIVKKLTEIERFSEQEFTTFSYEHFYCLITHYDKESGEFSIMTDKNVGFTTEQIYEITSTALSRNYPLGSMGTLYYKISYSNNAPQSIVVANFSHLVSEYRENAYSTLFAMSIIIFLISVFTWLFSFWVFKPAEEALFKQRQFISDVSHELKTPIAIISANADVLKNTTDSEFLDNIKTQSDRMGYLVNDLLTLSSLDEGSPLIKRGKFSASETVLKTILPFDAVAFEKGKFLKFDIDQDLTALGVQNDLAKICEILIDNAVKYADKETEIIVTLKKEGKKTLLKVYNRGCGVSKEDKERIFERFYRGDRSRARKLGGSGLGLSIAKSLAKKNRWKITANPKLDESMEITLSL